MYYAASSKWLWLWFYGEPIPFTGYAVGQIIAPRSVE